MHSILEGGVVEFDGGTSIHLLGSIYRVYYSCDVNILSNPGQGDVSGVIRTRAGQPVACNPDLTQTQ